MKAMKTWAIVLGVGAVFALAPATAVRSGSAPASPEVTVYKSPT